MVVEVSSMLGGPRVEEVDRSSTGAFGGRHGRLSELSLEAGVVWRADFVYRSPVADTDIELSLVSLVDSQYRERLRTLLKSKRGREKFIDTLYHHPRFDGRYRYEVRKSDSSPYYDDCIYADLVARGAPKEWCYAILLDEAKDGLVMPLRQGVDEICRSSEGGLLICIPGRLAYWTPEMGPGEVIERN